MTDTDTFCDQESDYNVTICPPENDACATGKQTVELGNTQKLDTYLMICATWVIDYIAYSLKPSYLYFHNDALAGDEIFGGNLVANKEPSRSSPPYRCCLF